MQKQRKIGKYWICNISAKEVEHTRKVQFISRRKLETRHTRNTPTGMGHLFDTWCLHTFCPKITAIRSNSRCHESLEFCVGRFGIFAASLNRIEVPFCWDSMCDILYIFHNIMNCTCVFSKHLRRRDASQKKWKSRIAQVVRIGDLWKWTFPGGTTVACWKAVLQLDTSSFEATRHASSRTYRVSLSLESNGPICDLPLLCLGDCYVQFCKVQ